MGERQKTEVGGICLKRVDLPRTRRHIAPQPGSPLARWRKEL